jgi:hypothetical protein
MSEQKESAIVVLVPEAAALVRSVRRRYNLVAARVPAHVTVLYPFKPPREITATVLSDLRHLFAQLPSFGFSLARLGTFPGTLYLVPTPGEPFVELTCAVHRQYPETPPYGGVFDEIIPHLTLAHLADEMPFEQAVKEVESALNPQLPIQVTATAITLLDNSCGKWCVRATFSLGC